MNGRTDGVADGIDSGKNYETRRRTGKLHEGDPMDGCMRTRTNRWIDRKRQSRVLIRIIGEPQQDRPIHGTFRHRKKI